MNKLTLSAVAAGAGVTALGAFLAFGPCGPCEAPAEQSMTPVLYATTAAEGIFKVDPVHSSIVFRVKHNNVSYYWGRFNRMEGTFLIDPTTPSNSRIEVKVPTESVDTANEGRDRHLRSPDFFSAAEFPELAFKSKSFSSKGDNIYDVQGELTLHGQTKPVTVRVEDTGRGQGRRGEVAGFEATLTIKRSEFGMTHMLGGIGDDVRIIVSLQGGR